MYKLNSKSEIETPTDSQMKNDLPLKSEGYDSGYALNYDNSLNSERDYNNRKGEGYRFYDGEKRIVRIQSQTIVEDKNHNIIKGVNSVKCSDIKIYSAASQCYCYFHSLSSTMEKSEQLCSGIENSTERLNRYTSDV